MSRKIQIVSPMWPSEEDVFIGIFVQNVARALEELGFVVDASAVIRGKSRGTAEKLRAHARLALSIAAGTADEADCIYLHAPSWFGPLTKIGRRPLIVHTHGGEVFPFSSMERWSQPAVGWILRRADLVIAPSAYYARALAHTFHLREEDIFVSPSGGVDTAHFRPGDRRAARRSLGLSEHPTIGFVGRIVPDKGWDTFLEVLGEATELHGVVAGEGEQLAEMRRRAVGLGDRVHFLGAVPQAKLPLVYTAMDAFLFPTRRPAECLGLVPLEAMACGVPVVGSDAYAVPEYVHSGKTGFCVPLGDTSAFTRATREAVAKTADLGQRARTEALRYDARHTTAQLAAEIERTLAKIR